MHCPEMFRARSIARCWTRLRLGATGPPGGRGTELSAQEGQRPVRHQDLVAVAAVDQHGEKLCEKHSSFELVSYRATLSKKIERDIALRHSWPAL